MNKDFRVCVDLLDNPKYVALRNDTGAWIRETLDRLWSYTAKQRPRGYLGILTPESSEHLETDALRIDKFRRCRARKRYPDKPHYYLDLLIKHGFIDVRLGCKCIATATHLQPRQGCTCNPEELHLQHLFVHDWSAWNGYASHAETRTAVAQKAANTRWQNRQKRGGKRDARSNARSMPSGDAPSPSPIRDGETEAAAASKGAAASSSPLKNSARRSPQGGVPLDFKALLEKLRGEAGRDG